MQLLDQGKCFLNFYFLSAASASPVPLVTGGEIATSGAVGTAGTAGAVLELEIEVTYWVWPSQVASHFPWMISLAELPNLPGTTFLLPLLEKLTSTFLVYFRLSG